MSLLLYPGNVAEIQLHILQASSSLQLSISAETVRVWQAILNFYYSMKQEPPPLSFT
jgi:hypothetical protein